MPHLLAIEADPARRRALTALVREHVGADLVIVGSVAEAIASINECAPDLIVAPTLLPPADDAELREHMKGLDTAPYIQMFTLPALDLLEETPVEAPRRRGLFGPVFNRRAAAPGRQYDRALVAAQLADGLRHARDLRMDYAAKLACSEAVGCLPEDSGLVLAAADRLPQASEASVQQQLRERARDERRLAPRRTLREVPWLSGVRMSRGAELELINISSTGLLIETGSKFPPGSTTHLHLCGPGTDLVVPVRFVRTDVTRIDGLGVRYRVAAAFATEIDLAGPRRETGQPPSQLDALAGLFRSVLLNLHERSEPAPDRFARGLRQLIGAQDVRACAGTMASSPGRATLYFEIPGGDPSATVLQVTFDRHHDVAEGEFRLLKAAAWLMAAVLELEKPISHPAVRRNPMALLAERVA